VNFEGFETYLHDHGISTDHEIREIISRVSWVETTLNISLDQMAGDKQAIGDLKTTLHDLIGNEEKAAVFYQAVWSYYEFCQFDQAQKT
jgi:hypothetical protein